MWCEVRKRGKVGCEDVREREESAGVSMSGREYKCGA